MQYNPDVLDALANLSNDEVFTPPKIVNQMLDLLPEKIRSDTSTTLLDPASKSGVFLREAAKRFIVGLEEQIPDLQERLNHIFTRQLFGIAITELTSLLSRRSLYCSKYANGEYSLCTDFDDKLGNIWYERTEHTWENGNCIYCGASQNKYERDYELETHAYKFIHGEINDISNLFLPYENMKFDVIIGNPPYQLSDRGNSASAKPLYHYFVEQAIKLQPRYLSMIIPSRRFTGGKGLDNFRKEMIQDHSMKELHDYFDAKECFPGVEIKGGVCYFLREKDYNGPCLISSHSKDSITSQAERYMKFGDEDVFIRYNEAISILEKIQSHNEKSFSSIVSSRKPFGFATNFTDYKSEPFGNAIKIYANKKKGFLEKSCVDIGKEHIDKYKIFIPKAIGSGDGRSDLLKPIIGGPQTCCTETYLMIGPCDTESEALNIVSYLKTAFFHFLLTLLKNTQDATSKVYKFIPMQDFSESWNDEKLFHKYKLSEKEIQFVKDMTHPSL